MNKSRDAMLVCFLLLLAALGAWLPGARAQEAPDRAPAGDATDVDAPGAEAPPHPEGPLADCNPDDIYEDNDTLATAAPVAVGTYMPLTLCSSDNADYFQVAVPAGHTLHVDLLFTHANGNINLYLYDGSGVLVASSNSSDDDVSAQMTVDAFGPYYVLAYLVSGASNTYTLQLRTSCDDCISYQGRLEESGAPVTGQRELQFTLYDRASGGQTLAGPIIRTVSATDGLFTTHLYFGETSSVYNGAPFGQAPYLEIGVRPHLSTDPFTILSPRQQLTPAPSALTLQPGALISGSVTGAALSLFNDQGGGLSVGSAGGDGLYVGSAGDNGLEVGSAGGDGVIVVLAEDDGVRVGSAGDDGVHVGSAGDNGLEVGSAGGDGLFVCRTGSETSCTPSSLNNGLEIGSAEDVGVYVRSAGNTGLYVNSAGGIGLAVGSASYDGVRVGSAGGDGVYIDSAGHSGLYVDSAGDDGVHVGSAGGDGLFVCSTGSETSCTPSSLNNGLEIGSAEAYGVRVGSAGSTGLYVDSAGSHGLYVDSAGSTGLYVFSAGGVGLYVGSAGSSGLYVGSAGDDGVYVFSAGDIGVYANTTDANEQWGFYTPDHAYINGTTYNSVSTLAQVDATVTEGGSVNIGDLVAVAGMAPATEHAAAMPRVELAGSANPNVIGVVSARMELVQDEAEEGEEGAYIWRMVSGDIKLGDTVLLMVYGIAEVKIDPAATESITAGQRLTAAGRAGRARPLAELEVALADGGTATMLEQAPTIGIVLEAPEAGAETVMVFVTLQ